MRVACIAAQPCKGAMAAPEPDAAGYPGDPALMSAATAAPVEAEGTSAFPSQYDADGSTAFDKVEADLRGKQLRILCEMPDGSVEEFLECYEGHDVQYAKGLLARRKDIQYGSISFYLNDKLMFDPLSFNDFADITGKTEVRIKVGLAPDPAPEGES